MNKNVVSEFYDEWSTKLMRWKVIEETLAIHLGYFKTGTKSLKEAVLNTNDYVAKLLKLDKKKSLTILDAGCGIGGTSIYLAKKYRNVKFEGITIAPKQAILAREFAKIRNVKNTEFNVGNYLNTGFPNNKFDSIFAIESFCYAPKHNNFIKEMHRILKPGGRLVVVDCFCAKRPTNSMMKNYYKQFCVEFGGANLAIINDYKRDLKNNGFKEIIIDDITKNVWFSVFLWSLPTLPYYIIKIIKRLLSGERDKKTNNIIDYTQGAQVLAAMIGVTGFLKYYGTSAIKI